jgi:hypothetical protein
MKKFIVIAVATVTLSACEFLGDIAKLVAADFYECPPNRTLVVCAPGTVPADVECVNVGSGQTTIAPRNCG